jgi:hypothetical protein
VGEQQLAKYYESADAVDPFVLSSECLLVVAFAKSNSKNYAFAMTIAEGAAGFTTALFGGAPMHVAAFARSQADVGRALALLSYVGGWKGTLVFAQGRLVQNRYQVVQVLNCFHAACACTDPQAHCACVMDDPFIERPTSMGLSMTITLVTNPVPQKEVLLDRYVFPCNLLKRQFRFEMGHPSSPQNQIEAAAIARGTTICPYFDASGFRMTTPRTVLVDAPMGPVHGRIYRDDPQLGDGGESR